MIGEIVMNLHKYLFIGLIILLLLTAVISISLRNVHRQSTKSSIEFSEIIKLGDLSDLSLTIYYLSPLILTRQPLSDIDLTDSKFEYKVTVCGSRLQAYIDLLDQINSTTLLPVEHESKVNARIYYVFETKKDGKILSVSMWGRDNSMFINGLEFKENNIFYDVIMPFLPEYAVKELEAYLE